MKRLAEFSGMRIYWAEEIKPRTPPLKSIKDGDPHCRSRLNSPEKRAAI
jgi:hypothetical protein